MKSSSSSSILSARDWKYYQANSGLVMAIYTVMHLSCHYMLTPILGFGGYETAISYQKYFRNLYQHPIFEVLLLASFVVHSVSNYKLYTLRQFLNAAIINSNKKNDNDDTTTSSKNGNPTTTTKNKNKELTYHRYAGYFLSVAIVGHVGATRIGPFLVLDDPSEYDYSFITYVINKFGVVFQFYLVVLGVAGTYHTVYGIRSAVATTIGGGKSVIGKPFPNVLMIIVGIGSLLCLSAVVALSGGYYYGVDMETKSVLHEKLYSKMGM